MHANRRDLLLAGACAASTALFWSGAARLMAEGTDPPPETTTIRVGKSPSICIAPEYVVSDLLTAEGITNVVYVESDAGLEQARAVAKGDIDLTTTDLRASEPALVAQRIVDRGFTARHDYAVQTLAEVPYNRWRDYDPEDTIRFYALRLREAGMLKSSPTKIIADVSDWRFLNEVRRELGG